MIALPVNEYTRIVIKDDTWIIVYQISPTIALCVRESDVQGGADFVNVILMQIA